MRAAAKEEIGIRWGRRKEWIREKSLIKIHQSTDSKYKLVIPIPINSVTHIFQIF